MKTTFKAAIAGAALVGFLAWAPVAAQSKTLKECNAEWTADKAALEASGKTKKAFLAECRGLAAAAKPATLGKGQFATEAEAKASCPGDAVVWVNLSSKVYHTSTSKSYGKTKNGAYMCEKDSAAAGFRAPKSTKKPA